MSEDFLKTITAIIATPLVALSAIFVLLTGLIIIGVCKLTEALKNHQIEKEVNANGQEKRR